MGLDTEYGYEYSLLSCYQVVRQQTLKLCEPLQLSDYELQAAEFVSPVKWHLAHTSWFFETFLLKPNIAGYQEFHPLFGHLFNSYYNGIGQPFSRGQRGLLSRPSLDDVLGYREHIDQAMAVLLTEEKHAYLIHLGLNHEQQHQELLLTDLLYCWSFNPLRPVYQSIRPVKTQDEDQPNRWVDFGGGIFRIGCKASDQTFSFDNEGPRHESLVADFALSHRLISNREYLEFIQDEGYQRAELWLSDGWSWLQNAGINAPLYWQQQDSGWIHYTLQGVQPLNMDAPVTHVSFYEADAFARWAGARLPTEYEWEVSARQQTNMDGNFIDSKQLRPLPASLQKNHSGLQQQFGDCWEWTSSPYQAYPGYQPAQGAVGEYNGKFMCNQMVLRGGSCLTPGDHIRCTYRNFFYPRERWQFTGIRLAKTNA